MHVFQQLGKGKMELVACYWLGIAATLVTSSPRGTPSLARRPQTLD